MRSTLVLLFVLAALIAALSACSAPGAPILAESSAPSPSPTAAPTPAPPITPGPTPYNAPYPASAVGYALSWPQCGATLPPEPYDFGIIGITNGRAMTRNPCFAELYGWAKAARYEPSIYMNTNYRHDLAVQLARDAGCGARPLCLAENYGWSAAEDAYNYAVASNAVAPVWWLDVQIVSEWSQDAAVNYWAIEGAGGFLRSKGIRVGISSTSFQWGQVAGDSHHKRPIWDASASTREQAAKFCHDGKDFGGGPTELIAWVDRYESVLACGPPSVPPS